jgi:hypothetical protein
MDTSGKLNSTRLLREKFCDTDEGVCVLGRRYRDEAMVMGFIGANVRLPLGGYRRNKARGRHKELCTLENQRTQNRETRYAY